MPSLIENIFWFCFSLALFRRSMEIFYSVETLIFVYTSVLIHSLRKPILHLSFFCFGIPIDKSLILTILFLLKSNLNNEYQSIIKLIVRERYTLIYTSSIVVAFIILEPLLILFFSKNTRRKSFHIVCFLIYSQHSKLIMEISNYLILASVLICKTDLVERYGQKFLNCKNQQKDKFSHFFLLCGMVLPYYFLSYGEYVRSLISICVMDSAASFVGTIQKSRRKTLQGFLFGQLAAYTFEYLYLREISYKYHLFVGFVEYYCKINDNISIPFFGTVFQKMIQGNIDILS